MAFVCTQAFNCAFFGSVVVSQQLLLRTVGGGGGGGGPIPAFGLVIRLLLPFCSFGLSAFARKMSVPNEHELIF